jgi:hypothetical protein
MPSSQRLRKSSNARQVKRTCTNEFQNRHCVYAFLLIDILAILLFLRDALKPGTFLTMNCFQTAFWGGVLIMDLVAIGQGANAAGIGFSVFIL